MRNFRNNNPKRHRFRSVDRGFKRNGDNKKFDSGEVSSNLNFKRKSPGKNNHNASKLIEKYNDLAREALSYGDKILSENYFQHADHFTRVLNEQEIIKRAKFSSGVDEKNNNLSTEKKEIQTSSDKTKEKLDKIQSEVN